MPGCRKKDTARGLHVSPVIGCIYILIITDIAAIHEVAAAAILLGIGEIATECEQENSIFVIGKSICI